MLCAVSEQPRNVGDQPDYTQPWPSYEQYGSPAGYPPGYPPPGYPPVSYGPPPPNHLAWAIVTTVMCCTPLGIVSIVKSNKVDRLWAQGQFGEAQAASAQAKMWAIWSAAAIGIGVVLYVGLMVTLGVTGNLE